MIVWLLIGILLVVFAILFVIASWKDAKRRQLMPSPQPEPSQQSSTLPEGFVPFAQRLKEQQEQIKEIPRAPSPFDTLIPFGIKYARVLNSIGIFIDIIAALFIIVTFLLAFRNPEAHTRIFLAMPWVIAVSAILLGFAFYLYKLNDGLIHLEGWAKNAQIILSILGLFIFPIGTILWGVCLYYMCFESKTNEAFERGL